MRALLTTSARGETCAAMRSAVASVARAMEQEIAQLSAQLPAQCSAADRARATVRAVGAGYLRFAREETGLFRTAFGGAFRLGALSNPDDAEHNPFRHLSTALDQLVAAGALPPARRPHAEFLAWSTVHGMALLVIDGPLRDLPTPLLEPLGQRLLDMVERGLWAVLRIKIAPCDHFTWAYSSCFDSF